jgi:hypothetical protein
VPEPALFHGIAVMIDDQIEDKNASVQKIREEIEREGCHVVGLPELPTDKGLANFREVAFFVLDWNLYGSKLQELSADEILVTPSGIENRNEEEVVQFLRDLKKVRFAPVFIFTDEVVEDVVEKLKQYSDIYDEADPSHILVMSKSRVSDGGLFNILSDWMTKAPSVYVLKKWEKAYEKAKNEMFVDFYTKSPQWPMILWKNFDDDGMPPATLLGHIIGRNLVSRMAPFECDLSPFMKIAEEAEKRDADYKTTVRKVLEGERYVADQALIPNAFEPGDIFLTPDGYFINIRPDCDCVARGSTKVDTLELYLLKGDEVKLSDLSFDREYGLIPEQDNQSIAFPVHEGRAIKFKFKKIYTKKWREVKANRVGRLLPPFLTKLPQKFSSYLQRPGLSRLPGLALPLADQPGTKQNLDAAPGMNHTQSTEI